MKVKDLERMANIAWSPASITPIYLAAGTAAQQFDASFSTNAALEVFALNLTDPSSELEVKSTTNSEHRFHKVVWGSHGSENGTIVGGCDNGIIQIHNASKLLNGENGLVATPKKHNGPVHSLDFNSFQGNLLASGAGESEIYIWDINNTNNPMTPGAKSQPYEDVVSIQWNKQVQHILASTFVSKCVVWDLRKNEPIIKLTDTVSRIRWKMVAWHPEVATQLCLASEEDQSPIIQLWDLRFATSPLKTLENHQRGVLSIAWCAQDSDLLISSGKDSRILCWNPNSNQQGGEVLSEIARTSQWNFDVTWCPKNPALIASPSFDGHVSVFSLMGGKVAQIQTTNKIADSFPGMDGYVQAPIQQENVAPVSVDLTKPPKWLKRPIGASFGFGGKLITFTNEKIQNPNIQPGQAALTSRHCVHISQVVTENELIARSMELEQALEYGNFIDYCSNKADSITDQHKKYIWHFLKANFEENPRVEILNLLGYRLEDVNSKLSNITNNIDGITDGISNLNAQGDFNNTGGHLDDFEMISKTTEKKNLAKFKIETGESTDGLITEAILMGNVEAAVELCLKAEKFTEAIIIARTGSPDLYLRTQAKYLGQAGGYLSSLISALVCEDWNTVVENCDINSWKEALVGILTHCNDDDYPILCEKLGYRLEQESSTNPKFAKDAQLCYICSGSFERLVNSWGGKTDYSTDDLQELVELVMFLQRSIERQNKTVNITGSLADLLSRYAFILASQGNLQTALNYLGNSQDVKISELRNRLYVNLGQKPGYVQRTQQRTSSGRQSFSYAQPIQTNQFNTGYNQFNTNPMNTATAQPWQPPISQPVMPPKPFSPAPVAPPSQPPRPTSTGPSQGGGLTSRAKYVLDPSVQSNQYRSTNQYAPNSMPSPIQNQPHMFQTNALSNAPTNPYMPNVAPLVPNNQQSHLTNPLLQNPISNNVTPLIPAPVTPLVPTSYQSPAPPVDVGQSALHGIPKSAAPGWNDPPAFTKSTRTQYGEKVQMSAEHSGLKLWKSKQNEPKTEMSTHDPITHPIYGSAPVPNQNIPGPYPGQQYNPSPMYNQQLPPQDGSQMFQPMQQGPPPSSFNPNNFNTQAVTATNFNNSNQMMNNANMGPPQQEQQQRIGRVEAPQPIQKAPIPEEHIHMQTVFDELRNKCSCTTNNPQTKRKLDDVAKKLESLYDLLREHKLSPNTLGSLHQMVQMVQHGDYANGLNLHMQMVSGPDFSQIASFMPGIKVLLQCALQLQVYIR